MLHLADVTNRVRFWWFCGMKVKYFLFKVLIPIDSCQRWREKWFRFFVRLWNSCHTCWRFLSALNLFKLNERKTKYRQLHQFIRFVIEFCSRSTFMTADLVDIDTKWCVKTKKREKRKNVSNQRTAYDHQHAIRHAAIQMDYVVNNRKKKRFPLLNKNVMLIGRHLCPMTRSQACRMNEKY